MVVPGDGITALQAAGRLPDPYWGRNEYDCRWVADRDWVLSRTVTLDDPNVEIIVDGLDTLATVRFNGEVVIEGQNAFRTYRWPVGNMARAGENEIEITFHSATKEAVKRQAAQPFRVPYSKNCPIPHGKKGRAWPVAVERFCRRPSGEAP